VSGCIDHVFLTLAIVGGDWSASRPCRFTQGKEPQVPPGVSVGPRAGLDDLEKILDLPGLELRPLGRPSRSHSLYRLRYPDTYSCEVNLKLVYNVLLITE
jgi:hypothetical protein